jgi:hypothetical protein
MRRIPLADAGKDGWSYDPSSIEQLIEARLRREEIAQIRLRERADAGEASLPFKRDALGLTGVELDAIWREAWNRFLVTASLSDELREQRQRFRETFTERLEAFRKNSDRAIADTARSHAVLFSRDCERAIGKAAGEFADMLVQVVIARRGRKDFRLDLRTKIWAECLRFAMRLARWESASVWVEHAWGSVSGRESPVPISADAGHEEQKRIAEAFSSEFRKMFGERIRHGSPGWLNEAERRIQLRCLLSYAPQRRARLDDVSKSAVARILTLSPRLTAREVCLRLDKITALVPKAWQKKGVRLWAEAYRRFPRNVKSYISKIKNESGISQISSRE